MTAVLALVFYHLSFCPAAAQTTFTERIQKSEPGKGNVTIHEDAQIDQLVNSANLTNTVPARPSTPSTPATTATTPGAASKPAATNPKAADAERHAASPDTVDMRKKVMRGGVKVNGYRVQAFAGGNSRKDRQQAERIGNDIKSHYADVPVYVHFYSPRWICRVGNYRTYEEAHQMLQNLRKLGYTQASIVRGKIMVQY